MNLLFKETKSVNYEFKKMKKNIKNNTADDYIKFVDFANKFANHRIKYKKIKDKGVFIL